MTNLDDCKLVDGIVVFNSVSLVETINGFKVLVNGDVVFRTKHKRSADYLCQIYKSIAKQQEIRRRGRVHRRGRRRIYER